MPNINELSEFERQSKDYLAAFNSGDHEKVASYWTDDAVSCPPMGEEVRGRAALRESYRQIFESVAPRITDYDFECRFSADVFFVRQSMRVTMHPPGQEPQNHRGRGLWVGRRESDGVWRVFWSLARFEA